jgi:hypothetical protein
MFIDASERGVSPLTEFLDDQVIPPQTLVVAHVLKI